ncbi:MarR family winged helix-turn-helix transcriptional regulator [Microbacterium panaciterrae]|uniref:MarR family transcriptional regulator n=1 Tax=Microbacterium panaciterrae TaxID=985759 RepID=A0ABP8PRP6_9MICO
MKNELDTSSSTAARRADELRGALREARVQLSVLNHRVGFGLEVRDTDFDCLDLISIHGPLNPTSLARLTGVRPATLTGILDRLERGGWIVRERDAGDRRAVTVRVLPDRDSDVYGLYAGMNAQFDRICADYDDAQLDTIAGFLSRVREAAATSTAALSDQD